MFFKHCRSNIDSAYCTSVSFLRRVTCNWNQTASDYNLAHHHKPADDGRQSRKRRQEVSQYKDRASRMLSLYPSQNKTEGWSVYWCCRDSSVTTFRNGIRVSSTTRLVSHARIATMLPPADVKNRLQRFTKHVKTVLSSKQYLNWC